MTTDPTRVIWRLEFAQPPGWHIAWLGPYTAHWLTPAAEELVRFMEAEHCATHPHPRDPAIFEAYPGEDRLACGCASEELLGSWFGDYLPGLVAEGGHITRYSVPEIAIAEDSPEQILFVHRLARVVERIGHQPSTPLVRSSARSRAALIESSGGRYAFSSTGRPPHHQLMVGRRTG